MIKVGFIGAGNMGSALARAAADIDGVNIYIYDKDENKARAVANELSATVATDEKIARECDYIFLGVKPNILPAVAESVRDFLNGRKSFALVSMAAGVSLDSLGKMFGENTPIIRIMPNTPVAVGCGMVLWCKNERIDGAVADGFLAIMKNAGRLDAIDESLIDAGSAVSGCGPAFVYMFIDAMAKAGEACGLSREQALLYAATTTIGAGEVLLSSDKTPDALREAVCSPGGSTIEGVKKLWEKDLDATVLAAIKASYEKTLLLGK